MIPPLKLPFEYHISQCPESCSLKFVALLFIKDSGRKYIYDLEMSKCPEMLFEIVNELKDILSLSLRAGNQYVWFFKTGEII